MENKFSALRVWRIAKIEFYKWIVNPRMIIAVAMIIFVWNFAVFPLMNLSKEMNSPLNVFEPFIAVLNSRVLCLVTPSVFLFLISDYPHLDRNSLFVLHRVKKTEWILGQFMFFIFAAFSFLGSIFIFSIIPNINNSFYANGWSLVVTRYGLYFPENASSFSATLITKELYNQIAPFGETAVAFSLTIMYMILIGMILLVFHVMNLRKFGVISATGIIAIGSALAIIKSSGMWVFPMAHTIVSLHYTEYLKEPITDLKTSFAYFLSIILLILVVCIITIRHTNFLNIDDNE